MAVSSHLLVVDNCTFFIKNPDLSMEEEIEVNP